MPAALYTDEDMSTLVATLLKSRGLDVTTVPEQATLAKKFIISYCMHNCFVVARSHESL